MNRSHLGNLPKYISTCLSFPISFFLLNTIVCVSDSLTISSIAITMRSLLSPLCVRAQGRPAHTLLNSLSKYINRVCYRARYQNTSGNVSLKVFRKKRITVRNTFAVIITRNITRTVEMRCRAHVRLRKYQPHLFSYSLIRLTWKNVMTTNAIKGKDTLDV